MGPYGEIQVVDRGGWKKGYPLVKAITQIGSDPHSDIVLDANRGGGVEGRHVQIICWSVAEHGYRLVNIADTDVAVGQDGGRVLAPRSATEVGDGDTFRIGEFSLSLRLSGDPDTAGHRTERTVKAEEQCIGLDVVLSMTQLAPNRTVEGAIVLRNLGDQDNVQFELDLEGLPSECYDIEPAPILFAGAEQQVLLRLRHTGKQPIAGTRTIEIHASAPRSYICNEVVVRRTIEVLPYYQYGLRWEEDRQALPDEPLGLPEPEQKPSRVLLLTRWWQRLKELFARKPAALPAPEPLEAETLPLVLETEPEIEEVVEAVDDKALFAAPVTDTELDQDTSDGSLGRPVSPPEVADVVEARESVEHSSVWVGPESEFGPPEIETPVVGPDIGESEDAGVESSDGFVVSERPASLASPVSEEEEPVSDVSAMTAPEPEALVIEDAPEVLVVETASEVPVFEAASEALSAVESEQVSSVLGDEPVAATEGARSGESSVDAAPVSDDALDDLSVEALASAVAPGATVEQTTDAGGWWEDEPQAETWWTSDHPAEPARDDPLQARPIKVVKAKVEPVNAEPEVESLPVIEPADSSDDDEWWSAETESDIEMEE